jgi:hypothetical protein
VKGNAGKHTNPLAEGECISLVAFSQAGNCCSFWPGAIVDVGYSHMDGRQTLVTRIRFIDSVTMVKFTTIELQIHLANVVKLLLLQASRGVLSSTPPYK